MLDVRRLRMLAALDRLGTVAAVAAELHLTAPGVSMQLGAFEREVGVPLTERRGRRLALTPAGRLLAAHGRDVVDRLSLAELEVAALRRGAVGAYRLAAFPSAARTFVAAAWRRLRLEDAALELTVTTPEPEQALAALASGEADLAVVHAYSNVPRHLPDGLTADPLASEPVRVAVPQDDAAAADVIDLADLRDRAWITPIRGVTCFEMTERACGLAGFRPRVVAESMDFAAQLELVAAGVGVALVPDLTVAALPSGVRLARTAAPIHRHISAARRVASSTDPGLDLLVGLLRETAAGALHSAGPLPA